MNEIKSVDVTTLKEWLDNDEVILIDVRELDEYQEAYIKGAILIPLNECVPQIIPHNPDKKIVFQCRKGYRSYAACTACLDRSPQKTLWNLEGGIDEWIAKGYEVTNLNKRYPLS
jgi:rhodanese-related sulfurtransferase